MKKLYEPKSISIKDMKAYGYTYNGMIPLTKEQALEAFDTYNISVFLLHTDDSEAMADDRNDVINHASHGGIFGVEYVDTRRQNGTSFMNLRYDKD